MTQTTKDRQWAGWVALQDGGHFQESLNAATEDGKFEILSQLLSRRPEKLRKVPQH